MERMSCSKFEPKVGYDYMKNDFLLAAPQQQVLRAKLFTKWHFINCLHKLTLAQFLQGFLREQACFLTQE